MIQNRQHKNISYSERLQIEVLYKQGFSAKDIAIALNRGTRTIYRELSRGFYHIRDYDYCEIKLYSADIAQSSVNFANSAKGAGLKIDKDFNLVQYIEHKIINQKYSPAAVLGEIKANNIEFDTTISKTTLYRYINDGLFLNVSNKHLPQGKRKNYNKIQRHARIKKIMVKSISQRVAPRDEFGHWEMDTVIGKRQGKESCLLVLTERKTRYEHIIKINDKSCNSVVSALSRLKKNYSGDFNKIFKTITCDNGAEFLGDKAIEKVTKVDLFYCHPYSSWERGSNENANKLIRRHIPKGQSINNYSKRDIKNIEQWMNNYPRSIHNYYSANVVFRQELQKIVNL